MVLGLSLKCFWVILSNLNLFLQLEKYKAKGSSGVSFFPTYQNGVSTTFSTHQGKLIQSALKRYDAEECSRYLQNQNVHSMRRKFSTGPQS